MIRPRRKRNQTSLLAVFVYLVLGFALASACSSERSVNSEMQSFQENFVAVAQDAGVDVASVSFCWHQLSSSSPTRLYVFANFEARSDTVAEVLRTQGMRIRDHKSHFIVQQHPNQPINGWTGQLVPDTHGSILEVVQHGFKQVEPGTISECQWPAR